MALTPADPRWCPVPSYAAGPAAPGPYVPPAFVAPDLCGERHHHALWPCPLHGCPHCALEHFEFSDPLDWEFPAEVDPDSLLGWTLTTVYENLADEHGCGACDEILKRSRWAWFPGSECEDTCTLAHCSECQRCGKAGDVCRTCGLCLQHQDNGSSPCEVTRWDPRSGETRTLGFSHDFWDPTTGRWGR